MKCKRNFVVIVSEPFVTDSWNTITIDANCLMMLLNVHQFIFFDHLYLEEKASQIGKDELMYWALGYNEYIPILVK